MVYTGATPDQYRDYNIDQVYPEVMEAMDLESKRLYKIVDERLLIRDKKPIRIATAQNSCAAAGAICRKAEQDYGRVYNI